MGVRYVGLTDEQARQAANGLPDNELLHGMESLERATSLGGVAGRARGFGKRTTHGRVGLERTPET